MEQWWKDNDGGGGGVELLEKERVTVPLRLPEVLHGLA